MRSQSNQSLRLPSHGTLPIRKGHVSGRVGSRDISHVRPPITLVSCECPSGTQRLLRARYGGRFALRHAQQDVGRMGSRSNQACATCCKSDPICVGDASRSSHELSHLQRLRLVLRNALARSLAVRALRWCRRCMRMQSRDEGPAWLHLASERARGALVWTKLAASRSGHAGTLVRQKENGPEGPQARRDLRSGVKPLVGSRAGGKPLGSDGFRRNLAGSAELRARIVSSVIRQFRHGNDAPGWTVT